MKDSCRAMNSYIPTSCWLFQNCFENECRKEQGYSVGTCFNGLCDASENENNCAADCCPEKNPQDCVLVYGKCPLECCGESSCCQEEDDESGTSVGLEILKWFGITVLIIIICCVMYVSGVHCICDGNVILPM